MPIATDAPVPAGHVAAPPRATLAQRARRFAARLGDLVPAQCAVCRRFPATTVCGQCVADLGRIAQRRCPCCATPLGHASAVAICGACRHKPPVWSAAAAALDYAFPWDELIGRFKFHGEPALARPLGRLMLADPALARLLDEADCVVPMPLSAARLAQRGFNQALELARVLAPGRVRADLLLRVRDTPAQHELPRAQRLVNLRHALCVHPDRQTGLRGRTVALVDDVMTTGASMHEASRCLLDAGADRVLALVLARAVEDESA